jgi:hypothetical protein
MLRIIIINLFCIFFINFCFTSEKIVDLKVVNNYQQFKFFLVDENNFMRYGFFLYSALDNSNFEANVSEEFKGKMNYFDIMNLATSYSMVEQNKFQAIFCSISTFLLIGGGIGLFFLSNYTTDDNWKITDHVFSGVAFGIAFIDLCFLISSFVMIAIYYKKFLTLKKNILDKLNGIDISIDKENSIKLRFCLSIKLI